MRDDKNWTPMGIFCWAATQIVVGMAALYGAVWWGQGAGALLAMVGLVCWLMTLTAWASHREARAQSGEGW